MFSAAGFTNKTEIPILNSSDIDVSLENFPYYLHDSTKNVLLSSTYLSLNCSKLAKVTSDLPTLRKPILLYGPSGSEVYQDKLTKALAKHFGARLLIIDSFGSKIEKNSAVGLQLVLNNGPLMLRNQTLSKRFSLLDLIYQSDETCAVNELFQVAASESKYWPLIIYLKKIENCIFTKEKVFKSFKYRLENLPQNVVVMASSIWTPKRSHPGYDLFMRVAVTLPWGDDNAFAELKQQFVRDAKALRADSNIASIRSCLDRRGMSCRDLEALCINNQTLKGHHVEKIVDLALSKHLMSNKIDASSLSEVTKFVISCQSLTYGFEIFKSRCIAPKTEKKSKECSLMKFLEKFEVNRYEKELLDDVIQPKEIGVNFQDVGALDNVKDALKEAVMLPLQRPELFSKGKLTKPCKGILLFGPPGTGKTMIAKAVATESGANFLNVTISRITSKWVGEGEKLVKAVFTLASKLSPCVIFFDEVDSFLGRRGRDNERETMRKMKNEFMINWDGLRTNANERVLVLAATNRPFDLDEAVVRRLPRRLMVTLPDVVNREKILKVILENEKMSPDFDLKEVANMTEGYSGGDLKNLCVAAAHCPIKELIEKESKGMRLAMAENKPPPALLGGEDIRPLNMGDFKYGYKQVCASVSSASTNMKELIQWNEQYGAGGSRKTEQLSYFI